MDKINISIVVPVYNVEPYLQECIESLLKQDIPSEIILINDGSTDHSGEIIEDYRNKYSNIRTIHQPHSGPSAARNQGLKTAKGNYITFVDSDDWIEENSLSKLHRIAIETGADIVRGNMEFTYTEKENRKVPGFDFFKGEILQGNECFKQMMRKGVYYPMACGYLYKSEWVKSNKLLFNEEIIHEDDLWILIAMCSADTVYLADVDYYYYRQRDGSIMHSDNSRLRLKSAFIIAKEFMLFAEKNKGDSELQGWIYINALRLFYAGLQIVAKKKDSSYYYPANNFYNLLRIKKKLPIEVQRATHFYISKCRELLKNYYQWKLSPFTRELTERELREKKVVLIYNNPDWHYPIPFSQEEIPEDYIITLDRRYFDRAFAVVYHLPDLQKHMSDELEKEEKQIWVGWSMECEENHAWMKDEEMMSLFDVFMNYHQDADIVCPYYANIKEDAIDEDVDLSGKENKICMIISSPVNQSKRIEYLEELMQHIEIDSYGRLFNNKEIENDNGRESKLDIYSRYKFVIAFENAICKDYVTEKFYDPLLAGSVPVYLGAPNIDDFVPGDKCYVNVKDFGSVKELSEYLQYCMIHDDEYMKYHQWRKQALKSDFVAKEKIQDEDPFVRLCGVLNEKLS